MSRSIKAMVAIYGDEGYILSRWGRKEEIQITQAVSSGLADQPEINHQVTAPTSTLPRVARS